MNIAKKIRHLFACALVLSLVACGSNSTDSGGTTENPPETPNLETYQPDTDFFQQNPQKVAQATTGFQMAKTIVTGTVDPLFMLPNIYLPFYTDVQGEGELNNGTWEWSYSYSYGGESIQIRRTARETSSQYIWTVYISYSGGEGPDIDNYKFMEVAASKEGKTGSWYLYPFGTESNEAVMAMDWDYSDEDNQVATYVFSDENGVENYDISYSNEAADFSIVIEGDGETIYIDWNEDTNVGQVQADGQTICWDGNFQDVSCG